MKNDKQQFYHDPWEHDYYGTGSTTPPKNRGGVIAILLIAVIVLGSVTTYLGIMNIRLSHLLELQGRDEGNLQLLQPKETEDGIQENHSGGMLNVQCTTVSDFDARFYTLPYGCLVTGVVEDGAAEKAGLCTGDVIISLDKKPVPTVEILASVLRECKGGQTVTVEIYRTRTEKNLCLEVILDERGESE